jgi:hypothetical protein
MDGGHRFGLLGGQVREFRATGRNADYGGEPARIIINDKARSRGDGGIGTILNVVNGHRHLNRVKEMREAARLLRPTASLCAIGNCGHPGFECICRLVEILGGHGRTSERSVARQYIVPQQACAEDLLLRGNW